MGNGLIAFPRHDSAGRQQLYVTDLDGTEVRPLTSEGYNGLPSWSPDGSRLVYAHREELDGPPSIWVMDADGGNQRQIVAAGDAPTFGPVGRIAFVASPSDTEPSEVWLTDETGAEPDRVTFADVAAGVNDAIHPTWSPDGDRIAFVRFSRYPEVEDDTSNGCPSSPIQPDLWIVDLASGRESRASDRGGFENVDANGGLINTAHDANAPSWSPNDVIAFWSGQEFCFGQVWKMAPDGSERVQLTEAAIPARNDDPSWSPDGTMLLFGTNRRGGIELWVMDADGNDERFVTAMRPGPFPGDAAWQPVSSF